MAGSGGARGPCDPLPFLRDLLKPGPRPLAGGGRPCPTVRERGAGKWMVLGLAGPWWATTARTCSCKAHSNIFNTIFFPLKSAHCPLTSSWCERLIKKGNNIMNIWVFLSSSALFFNHKNIQWAAACQTSYSVRDCQIRLRLLTL